MSIVEGDKTVSNLSVVVPQSVQLRAVETFIKDYKKLTPEDIRNIKRMSYEDLQKAFRARTR